MVSRGEPVKVLYICGVDAPTSVPLEVAATIREKTKPLETVDVEVSVFRETSAGSDQHGRQVVPIGARSACDLRGVWNLYRYMKNRHPDVIHVHHTVSAFWGGVIGKFVSGTSVVRTEHNNQKHYSTLQSLLHGFSQLLADKILCNSEDTYRNLYGLQKWAVGKSWETVYNGVDVMRIDTAKQRSLPQHLKIPADRTLIGSVGRLVDQKNYKNLIRAFPSVLREIPNAHLVLIGDGKKRGKLVSMAASLSVGDRITFAGELARDDVYAVLHHFDLFVMPSLWEGFCNAVVEAMAAGVPIVCSDISTLQEVVGGVGNFVDPEDPDDIAQGIVDILRKDPEERSRMGKGGRRRATNHFSLQRTADEYIKTYLEVTGADPKEIMPTPS
jgi:glycosyltransferase involved in cell wall biosynthesis